MTFRTAAALLALAAASIPAGEARADTTECTAITTATVTIDKQGLYCLKKNLPYSADTGSAITVAANNVTIDCNGFNIELQKAFPHSIFGVRAEGFDNVTVRNCSLEGFRLGIKITGDGALVEGNVVRNTSTLGIHVVGNQGVVRDNHVIGVGGVAGALTPEGIRTNGNIDVIDNLVASVSALPGSNDSTWGIRSFDSTGAQVARNRVSGLAPDGTGLAAGIVLSQSTHAAAVNNTVVHSGAGTSYGVTCSGIGGHATGNHLVGWSLQTSGCVGTSNISKP